MIAGRVFHIIMKILILDTETTGLPTERNAPFWETEKWPYIVQLSYILYDLDANAVTVEHDFIVKMKEEIKISPESIKIHGITNEISRKRGHDIKDVLDIFHICLEQATYVVAHNLSFDKTLMMAEYKRNNLPNNFSSEKIYYCTMKKSKELCNFSAVNYTTKEKYIRYPKLLELHNKLFGVVPNNLHNSFVDILVCFRCFYKMVFDVDILKINRHIRSLFKKYC